MRSEEGLDLEVCDMREIITMIGVYLVLWIYVRETSDYLVPVEPDFQRNLGERMYLIHNGSQAEGDSPYV
jgi:hypothetical protein